MSFVGSRVAVACVIIILVAACSGPGSIIVTAPAPVPGTATLPPAAEIPTEEATEEPTAEPTEEPTVEPTQEPTVEPTEEPTAEPTEEPTVEPTQEPTAEPTEEPAAEAVEEPAAESSEPGAEAGQAAAIPHPVELNEDCLECHAVDSRVYPAPEDHAGRAVGTCQMCHLPTELPGQDEPAEEATEEPAEEATEEPEEAAAPEGDVLEPPLQTGGEEEPQGDAATCLACHGPFATLNDAGASFMAGDGKPANPHIYVPHDTQRIPDCTRCHEAHELPPPADVSAEGTTGDWCYSCHHTGTLAPCQACHAE